MSACCSRTCRSRSRLRAALICLWQRPSAPELLVLDEPTSHLDFLGYDTLQALLQQWRAGLIVATHDEEFMQGVGLDARLRLGAATHTYEREMARRVRPARVCHR